MLHDLTDPQNWQIAGDILLKCGIAVLLAAIIGWEREMHGRPAGVRTHMLVALGTVLFSAVGERLGGDPGRVAAQVVTGIGFLGAGTIMRMGAEVRGLTTAASVWATAGIAMAVAAGGPSVIVAIIATVLALLTLALVDDLVRRFIRNPRHRALTVSVTERAGIAHVIQELSARGIGLTSLQIVSTEPDVELALKIEGPEIDVLQSLTQLEHVKSARWSD